MIQVGDSFGSEWDETRTDGEDSEGGTHSDGGPGASGAALRDSEDACQRTQVEFVMRQMGLPRGFGPRAVGGGRGGGRRRVR